MFLCFLYFISSDIQESLSMLNVISGGLNRFRVFGKANIFCFN